MVTWHIKPSKQSCFDIPNILYIYIFIADTNLYFQVLNASWSFLIEQVKNYKIRKQNTQLEANH